MADFCISDVYDETAEISWNDDSYIGRHDLIEGASDFYAAMNLVKSFGA